MPIGADEVTVLDHTGGFGIFVNGGKSVTPHAILEVRTGTGDLVWRFDRDGKKPDAGDQPAGRARHEHDAEQGGRGGHRPARDAPGIKIAGKTGTTNAYRDAWFVGYTGNYVAGVWFGNDDYSPTNRMTGGSLPAMTWREIMAYAHQGIELRPLPGVGPQAAARGAAVAAAPAPQQRPRSRRAPAAADPARRRHPDRGSSG